MAWLGKRDIDANDFRVIDETRSVVCIVLGNQRTDAAFNRAICEGLFALIGRTCPDASLRFLDTIVDITRDDVRAAARA